MNKFTRVEKKRRKKRIIRRVFLIASSLLIAYNILIRIDYFNIKEITINGNSHLNETKIIDKAEINIGDSLFKVNRFSISNNIKTIGYIEDVKLKKKLPNILEINIQERIPYVEILTNDIYYVFDSRGILLEKRNEPLGGITLISNFPIGEINEGQELELDYRNFLDIFNDEKTIEVVNRIKYFDLEDNQNIKIILDKDIPVEFGSIYNMKYKLLELGEIIKDIEKKNIPTKMIIMNKGEYPILVRDDY